MRSNTLFTFFFAVFAFIGFVVAAPAIESGLVARQKLDLASAAASALSGVLSGMDDDDKNRGLYTKGVSIRFIREKSAYRPCPRRWSNNSTTNTPRREFPFASPKRPPDNSLSTFSNFVICHTKHTPPSGWQHAHQEVDIRIGGTIGYEVSFVQVSECPKSLIGVDRQIYAGQGGVFKRQGDGGYINWAWIGRVNSVTENGSRVDFAAN
jgi:hypothetical protein